MQSTQEKVKLLQQAISKDDLETIVKLSQELMRDNSQNTEYKQCYGIAAIKSKQFQDLSTGIFK